MDKSENLNLDYSTSVHSVERDMPMIVGLVRMLVIEPLEGLCGEVDGMEYSARSGNKGIVSAEEMKENVDLTSERTSKNVDEPSAAIEADTYVVDKGKDRFDVGNKGTMGDLYRLLNRYQEAGQLLDSQMNVLVSKVVDLIRTIIHHIYTQWADSIVEDSAPMPSHVQRVIRRVQHHCIYLQFIAKVRGYKSIFRFFSHEVTDVEPLLFILLVALPKMTGRSNGVKGSLHDGLDSLRDTSSVWEARYILLGWLAMVMLVPFDLTVMDSVESKDDKTINDDTINESIFKSIHSKSLQDKISIACVLYIDSVGCEYETACLLTMRFLTRKDVIKDHLGNFFTTTFEYLRSGPVKEDMTHSSYLHGFNRKQLTQFQMRGLLTCLAMIYAQKQCTYEIVGDENVNEKCIDFLYEINDSLISYIDKVKFGDPMNPNASDDTFINKLTRNSLNRRFVSKVACRIATMSIEPPKKDQSQQWMYNMGQRNTINQDAENKSTIDIEENKVSSSVDNPDSYSILPMVEPSISILLLLLQDDATAVRWSAAKGISRVVSRLPLEFRDDVIQTVIESFEESTFESNSTTNLTKYDSSWSMMNPEDLKNTQEKYWIPDLDPINVSQTSDKTWHGACLAIAEMIRRSLLTYTHIERLSPWIQRALIFDQNRGSYSLGSQVRDAACYICWALPRAYIPGTYPKHVIDLLFPKLVTLSLLDRESTVRRAASAAIQELVGRYSSYFDVKTKEPIIKNGIDIVQLTDFYSLGSKFTSWIRQAIKVAHLPHYRKWIIGYLGTRLCLHWDVNIHPIASKSLKEIVYIDFVSIYEDLCPYLVEMTKSNLQSSRSGAMNALGSLYLSLAVVIEKGSSILDYEFNDPELDKSDADECVTKYIVESKSIMDKLIAEGYLRTASKQLVQHQVVPTWTNFPDSHIYGAGAFHSMNSYLKLAASLAYLIEKLNGKVDERIIQGCIKEIIGRLIYISNREHSNSSSGNSMKQSGSGSSQVSSYNLGVDSFGFVIDSTDMNPDLMDVNYNRTRLSTNVTVRGPLMVPSVVKDCYVLPNVVLLSMAFGYVSRAISQHTVENDTDILIKNWMVTPLCDDKDNSNALTNEHTGPNVLFVGQFVCGSLNHALRTGDINSILKLNDVLSKLLMTIRMMVTLSLDFTPTELTPDCYVENACYALRTLSLLCSEILPHYKLLLEMENGKLASDLLKEIVQGLYEAIICSSQNYNSQSAKGDIGSWCREAGLIVVKETFPALWDLSKLDSTKDNDDIKKLSSKINFYVITMLIRQCYGRIGKQRVISVSILMDIIDKVSTQNENSKSGEMKFIMSISSILKNKRIEGDVFNSVTPVNDSLLPLLKITPGVGFENEQRVFNSKMIEGIIDCFGTQTESIVNSGILSLCRYLNELKLTTLESDVYEFTLTEFFNLACGSVRTLESYVGLEEGIISMVNKNVKSRIVPSFTKLFIEIFTCTELYLSDGFASIPRKLNLERGTSGMDSIEREMELFVDTLILITNTSRNSLVKVKDRKRITTTCKLFATLLNFLLNGGLTEENFDDIRLSGMNKKLSKLTNFLFTNLTLYLSHPYPTVRKSAADLLFMVISSAKTCLETRKHGKALFIVNDDDDDEDDDNDEGDEDSDTIIDLDAMEECAFDMTDDNDDEKNDKRIRVPWTHDGQVGSEELSVLEDIILNTEWAASSKVAVDTCKESRQKIRQVLISE